MKYANINKQNIYTHNDVPIHNILSTCIQKPGFREITGYDNQKHINTHDEIGYECTSRLAADTQNHESCLQG